MTDSYRAGSVSFEVAHQGDLSPDQRQGYLILARPTRQRGILGCVVLRGTTFKPGRCPALICCRSQALKSRRNEESLADASGEQELAWRPWFSKSATSKSVSDGQLSSIDQGQKHKVPDRSAWFLLRPSRTWWSWS